MPKKVHRLLITACMLIAVSSWTIAAQDKDKDEQQAGKNVTVTGCLAKGESPNEFHLTAENGKTYDVRSDSTNLSEHVGHKVKVTGVNMKESAAEEKHEKGERSEAPEAGNLRVSKVEHLSDTCK